MLNASIPSFLIMINVVLSVHDGLKFTLWNVKSIIIEQYSLIRIYVFVVTNPQEEINYYSY